MRLFEEAGILAKHDFGDGRARYEETPSEHHDHLIDIQSGKVVEFHNDEIEDLQRGSPKRPDTGWSAIVWNCSACPWTGNPTGRNEWTSLSATPIMAG